MYDVDSGFTAGPAAALAERVESVTMPVLGIPTRFESNAREVIAIAEEAFAAWRVLESDPAWITAYPARVRVVVREGGGEEPGGHAALRWEFPEKGVYRFTTPGGSEGHSDSRARRAHAVVSPALVADRQHFRYGVLEALTMAVLTGLDREPLHAAAIVRGGTALLLAGRSGVGKSTLTYASARAGLKVLAEDIVFLQKDPALRVWGMPGWLHLDPDARAHYPELREAMPTLRNNGKLKLAVPLHALGAVAARPVVERAGVCLLERGPGPASLVRLAPDEVVRALCTGLEEGFVLFEDSIGARVRLLARHGGWRLTLAGAPDDALPFLHRMFDAMDRGE